MVDPIRLRFINPIPPTVFNDGITYIECLGKLQAKINECIEVINSTNIEQIRQELNDMKLYLENELYETQQRVNQQLADNIRTVDRKLALQDVEIKDYVEQRLDDFSRELDFIFLSPVSGIFEDLQIILNELYDSTRTDAITADQYDNLELTASYYDSLNLSADDYDYHAATILL